MGGYDKKDAARETNVTVKEVSKAWHTARDDHYGKDQRPSKSKSDK